MSRYTLTHGLSEEELRIITKIRDRLRSSEILSKVKRDSMAAELDAVLKNIEPMRLTERV